MKLIPLSNGGFAKVDDEDFEYLSKIKWSRHPKGYAMNNGRYMHRIIMNPPDGFQVDHINLDKGDNQKSNLRFATTHQNKYNRGKQKDNTTGFKGVFRRKDCNRWESKIGVEGKKIYLGCFEKIEGAIEAYANAVRKYHGEFARV